MCFGRRTEHLPVARPPEPWYGAPPMDILVNGESRSVDAGTSVVALLEILGLGDTLVAVERNEQVVPRAKHRETLLAEGDEIEVVHFVGGG